MRIRHWLLLIGSFIAIATALVTGITGWPVMAFLGAGALVGIWAIEGPRERAEAHGVRIKPL